MADKSVELWGSKVVTQTGNSEFYVHVWIEQRNYETYAEIRWWYAVTVWKGNFLGSAVKTSWGSTANLNGTGDYANSGWSAWTRYNYGENVPFNAQWASYPNGTHKSQTSSYYLVESPVWKPNAPTGGSATRSRDTLVNLAWTNNPTASRPYESLVIERKVNGGNWTQLKTVGANVTSATDTTTSANNTYQYRIKAANKNASSDYLTLGTVYMTPSAPTNLTWSRVSDTTVRLNFTNNANTATGLRIEAKTYGAADTTYQLVTTVSGKVSTADITLGANADGYAVRIANTRGNLMSGWLTSTKIVTVTPPNAPTLLAPGSSEIVRKDMESVTLEWAHNPVDGSAQTGVVVEYSTDNATWNALAAGATASSATLSLASIAVNATVYWRVKTKGAHASYGAYSQSQFIVRQVPSVGVTSPSTIVTTTPVHYRFTYDDVSGSMRHHVLSITDSNGNVVFTKTVQGAETEGVIERDEFLLDDGATYTLSVTALSTSTLESTGTSTFDVLYELPVNANIELEQDVEEGAVIVKASPKEREYSAQGAFTSNGYEQVGFMSPNGPKNLLVDMSMYNVRVDDNTYMDFGMFRVDGHGLVHDGLTFTGYNYAPNTVYSNDILNEQYRNNVFKIYGGKTYSLSMMCSCGREDQPVAEVKLAVLDADYKQIAQYPGWPIKESAYSYFNATDGWNIRTKIGEKETYVDYLEPVYMPDNAEYVVLTFITYPTSFLWRVYDIQLEVSDEPTPFENPRFPQLELLEKKDSLDSLTINGSAERKVSRNLLDINTTYPFFVNGSTGVIQSLSDGISYVVRCAPNTQYVFNKGTRGTDSRLVIGSSSTFPEVGTNCTVIRNGDGTLPYTFTTGNDAKYLVLFLDRYKTNIGTEYQLELGFIPTDYEPYFAPYVDVVRGRNLLDNTSQEYGQYASGGWQSAKHRITTPFIPIVGGETLTARIENADLVFTNFNYFDKSKTWLGNRENNGIGSIQGSTIFTTNPLDGNAAYIRLTLQDASSSSTQINDRILSAYQIQLERGSIATPYVPYGQLGVGLVGKNLLDSAEIQTAAKTSAGLITEYAGDGWFSVNGESTASGANASLIMYGGNTGYVSSIVLDNRHGSVAKQFTLGFDIDGTWPDSTTCRVQVMYYVDGDTSNGIGAYAYKDRPAYIPVPPGRVFNVSRVCVYRASGSAGSVFDCRIRPMLSEGSEPSDYEPYVEGRYGIDLAGNALASLPNGTMDVLRKDTERTYIEKRVGVVDLGSLSWTKHPTYKLFYCSAADVSRLGYVMGGGRSLMADYTENATSIGSMVSGQYRMADFVYVYSDLTDATAFKAAMQGVMLYYELAEPYIVELEHGEEIRLLKPITYMNVDTVRDTEVTAVVVRGGIVASSFDIQRISGNGNVTILSDATGAVEFVDRYAPANTDYQYRVVTYADSGAFDSTYVDARLDTPYWYLVGDEVVAKIQHNKSEPMKISCVDASLNHFQGARYPKLYNSDKLSETVSASGIVFGKSEVDKFRLIQRQGGKAFYKSFVGDTFHVHCETSDERLSNFIQKYQVSVDMTRIEGGDV